MEFTLRVVFEGVFAFVPDEPFFTWGADGEPVEGKPKKVWVLVPDLVAPDLADWDREKPPPDDKTQPDYRETHLPILSFEESQVRRADRGRISHLRADDRIVGSPMLFRLLDVEKLSITENDGDLKGGLNCDTRVPNKDHRVLPRKVDNEHRSLWWLPRIEEISKGHGRLRSGLNPDCPNFDIKKSGLAAILCLKAGSLFVDGFNQRGNKVVAWDFAAAKRGADHVVEPPDNVRTWRRAIGNRIVWEVKVQASRAYLHYGSSPNPEPPICLRRSFLGSSTVQLMLTNQEPERMLVSEVESAEGALRFDPDFQVLYDLAAPENCAHARRYPYSKDVNIGKFGRPCAGGAASGFA